MLNGIYLSAALAIAAVLGLITESWVVFVIALAVLIGANVPRYSRPQEAHAIP